MSNDLTGGRKIVQGATFESSVFARGVDLTGWSIRGQVRAGFADAVTVNGVLPPPMAEFTIGAVTYGPTTLPGETTPVTGSLVPITLTANQTRQMPATTRFYWRYDLEAIAPNGRVVKLPPDGGLVQVWPEVTRA